MDKVIKDLEQRRKKLADDKQRLAEITGQEKELLKQLKDFDVETLDEAKQKLEKLRVNKDNLLEEIKQDYKDIQERFPINGYALLDALLIVANLLFFAAIVYVIAHFVVKFW